MSVIIVSLELESATEQRIIVGSKIRSNAVLVDNLIAAGAVSTVISPHMFSQG